MLFIKRRSLQLPFSVKYLGFNSQKLAFYNEIGKFFRDCSSVFAVQNFSYLGFAHINSVQISDEPFVISRHQFRNFSDEVLANHGQIGYSR